MSDEKKKQDFLNQIKPLINRISFDQWKRLFQMCTSIEDTYIKLKTVYSYEQNKFIAYKFNRTQHDLETSIGLSVEFYAHIAGLFICN